MKCVMVANDDYPSSQATGIHPEKKTVRKCNRIVKRVLSSQTVQEILRDDTLDR